MSALAHPALPLGLAALLVLLVSGRARSALLLLGPALALSAVLVLPDGAVTATLLGSRLRLLEVDALSRLFGSILALVTLLGTLYALHLRGAFQHLAAFGYAAGALAVVFAGDWLSLFVGWELMAVTSTGLVLAGGGRARAAGFRYLCVHTAGGALLLAGMLLGPGGGGAVGPLEPGLARLLILSGVAVNAAIPPLHAWLTDAYPEASVTGSVFLSALTTKTAVYVLLRVFPGEPWLVPAGVAMALYGVVFAVLENDIRRLLAYHIVSQVGYMVAAVGVGTPLALAGAAAHAFCHILYKALLFMGAGAVIEATGERRLDRLGGLAGSMPWVFGLYMVGAVSISGVPLFNGFISKPMVVDATGHAGWPVSELLLLLASVGTFLHTGLKLPWFTFMGARGTAASRPVPPNMIVAMAAAALACFALGVFPGWLYARLPQAVDYQPYTLDHVISALQLLLGTALGFAVLRPRLQGEPTISLDTDAVYRLGLVPATRSGVVALQRAGARLRGFSVAVVATLARALQNPAGWLGALHLLPDEDPEPNAPAYDADRHRHPIGATVVWVVVYLGAFALFLAR